MTKKETKVFKEIPTLETERFILRQIVIDDAEDMFAYASDPEVARYVTWSAHQSLEDSVGFLHFLQDLYAKGTHLSWGIVDKATNRLIGTVGYVSWNQNHNIGELGYALAKDYWGRGVMTEVVKPLLKFGFEHMELNRVEARCDPLNIGSERVMQKVGMSYEGLLRQRMFLKGEYHDLKLYSILREEWLAE